MSNAIVTRRKLSTAVTHTIMFTFIHCDRDRRYDMNTKKIDLWLKCSSSAAEHTEEEVKTEPTKYRRLDPFFVIYVATKMPNTLKTTSSVAHGGNSKIKDDNETTKHH